MTTPSTSQTNPLDPVFSGVPMVVPNAGLVNPTWNKWFVDLREKVNVINSTLAAWSGITPVTGLTPGTYGDATHYPKVTVNEFGLITAITTQSVSGGGGNPMHVTTVTGSYTITLADIPAASANRGMIVCNSSSAATITIDSFANIAAPTGSDLMVFQEGTGAVTIISPTGVTLRGPSITGGGQYSMGRAVEISQDVWVISGNLAWQSAINPNAQAFIAACIAYYPCNSDMNSVVGSANAFTGTAPTYVTGIQGNAASLASVMSTSALPTGYSGSPVSFGGWFSVGSLNQIDLFLSRNTAVGNYECLALQQYNGFRFAVNPPGIVSGGTAATNTWYFLVGTYDGTTITIYCNNVVVGTLAASGTPQTGNYLQLGYAYSNLFNMKMCQLFICNTALSTSVINYLYNSGAGKNWTQIQADA